MIDQCVYDGIIIEIVGAMSNQDSIIVVRSHYVIAELYDSVSTSEHPLSVSASVIARWNHIILFHDPTSSASTTTNRAFGILCQRFLHAFDAGGLLLLRVIYFVLFKSAPRLSAIRADPTLVTYAAIRGTFFARLSCCLIPLVTRYHFVLCRFEVVEDKFSIILLGLRDRFMLIAQVLVEFLHFHSPQR